MTKEDQTQRALTHLAATRARILLFVIFATYAPFSWILLINENRGTWVKLWPNLHGIMFAELLSAAFRLSSQRIVTWSPLVSALLPAIVLFLLFRFPQRRRLVGGLALLFFSILSAFAYGLYLA